MPASRLHCTAPFLVHVEQAANCVQSRWFFFYTLTYSAKGLRKVEKFELSMKYVCNLQKFQGWPLAEWDPYVYIYMYVNKNAAIDCCK